MDEISDCGEVTMVYRPGHEVGVVKSPYRKLEGWVCPRLSKYYQRTYSSEYFGIMVTHSV